jgi:hypothetical protein
MMKKFEVRLANEASVLLRQADKPLAAPKLSQEPNRQNLWHTCIADATRANSNSYKIFFEVSCKHTRRFVSSNGSSVRPGIFF